MGGNTATKLRDASVVDGGRKCSNCGKVKPVEQFAWIKADARHHSWCNICRRIDGTIRQNTPESLAKRAAYKARPEVKAKRKAYDASRSAKRLAYVKGYQKTDRGRIVFARINARYRLRRATTDEQRATLQALIDKHTAALAGLDAYMED